MRRSLKLVATIATPCIALAGLSAQGSVVLSDDYNRTSGVLAAGNAGGLSDWGANSNALGGSVVQTYKVRDTAAGASTEQQVVDGNFGRLRLGHGVVNHDLLSDPQILQNGFTASFDFQRGGGGYIAFALGMTPTEIQNHPQTNARIGVPFASNIPEMDFGFLFRPPASGLGQSEIWKGGVSATGPLGIFDATPISGSPTSLINNAVVEFIPAVAGQWGAGATINVALTVNNAALPQFTTSFVSDGSGVGYFGFHSNAGAAVAQAAVDNLVIRAVPEPAALGLVGMIGGVLLNRRRR